MRDCQQNNVSLYSKFYIVADKLEKLHKTFSHSEMIGFVHPGCTISVSESSVQPKLPK